MKFTKILLTLSSLILISSCGNGNKGNEEIKSPIKGKYKNETSISVYHKRVPATDDRYLYSTVYPFSLFNSDWSDPSFRTYGCYDLRTPSEIANKESAFIYTWSEVLMLQKDYTYHYTYNVNFGNPQGNPNLMSVEVDIYGTYIYEHNDYDNSYTVNLSSPTSGTEKIYGCHFAVNELWWFGGGIATKHSDPDKEIDFALLSEVDRYETDFFTRSRDVKVIIDAENPANNNVIDDLFYSYYLDYVGQYCTYQ